MVLMTDSFAQEQEVIEEIIIDRLLFNQPNQGDYSFTVHNGAFTRGARREEIKNINDVIRVDKSCIRFKISYGCGCGKTSMKLVTDGVERKDKTGKVYYQIRLLFIDNDICKALCYANLAYNLTGLKKNSASKVYVKFEDFEELIDLE